ncbi:hypothetical protein GN956_G20380 [Arapaima gigas]
MRRLAGRRQAQYLVCGERERDGSLLEQAELDDFQGDPGGTQHPLQPPPPPQQQVSLRAARSQLRAGRTLSRQDTFDSETQGSRDSAYTEAGDSCMDVETDPYEEPEPYRGGGGRTHPGHLRNRQASWEDEGAEPDQENLNRATVHEKQGRTRPRETYCQDPEDTSSGLGHNHNQEDWARDAAAVTLTAVPWCSDLSVPLPATRWPGSTFCSSLLGVWGQQQDVGATAVPGRRKRSVSVSAASWTKLGRRTAPCRPRDLFPTLPRIASAPALGDTQPTRVDIQD